MAEQGFLRSEAAGHYASGYEATRLFGSAQGELERMRSQEIIARHLPPAPARILDVGGAGGVYSLWLLDRGYEVGLIDALALHVEMAQRAFEKHARKGSAAASVGDARELHEPDASVHGVLLMGPLYHLVERADRVQALREANRVLCSGGVVFAAAVSRYASHLDGLSRDYVDDPVFCGILAGDLATGRHENPANHPDYFTTAYFHRPDELSDEIREAGFSLEGLAGVEGPAWLLPNLAERLSNAAKRDQLLGLLRRVESEPALMGVSAHLLAVGRKG
jgi:ubiquinone/menaquinone biosynthesis C-methylase UbiE